MKSICLDLISRVYKITVQFHDAGFSSFFRVVSASFLPWEF